MKNTVERLLNRIKRDKRRKYRLAAVLLVLSLLVSSGVMWQLRLTAITLAGDTYCGIEEHAHNDECINRTLICDLEESGHIHSVENGCYEQQRTLACDVAGHVHSTENGCYEEQSALICEEAHEHTDECYETQQVLTCDEAEHTHADNCYSVEDMLVCTKPNDDGHIHDEACYEIAYICGQDEHQHTLACYSDPTADVETASVWETTLPNELMGIWREDLLTVARSQLGYTESTKNYMIDEDGNKKGYTRYGDWYGNAYGDWCAMFVSFCLHYAGVSDMPLGAGCEAWLAELERAELKRSGLEYTPVPGDLIFYDGNTDGRADHVGLVETLEEQEDGEILLHTIEGNLGNCVSENTVPLDDASILCYAALPERNTLTYSSDTLEIELTYPPEALIPDSARLVLREISGEEHDALTQEILTGLGAESMDFTAFFEFSLLAGKQPVHPAAPVTIRARWSGCPELEESLSCGVVRPEGGETELTNVAMELDGRVPVWVFTVQETGLVGLAAGQGNTSLYTADPNVPGSYPTAVVKDPLSVDCVALYNMEGSITGAPLPLAGVTYTVYKASDDSFVRSYTSVDDYMVRLDGLTPGVRYYVMQTETAPGYVLNPQKTYFTVDNDGRAHVGIFKNFKREKFNADKTAQVVDYANRTYQIDLQANSGMYNYEASDISLSLVVDQSNSMLFPADLQQVGTGTVTFTRSGSNNDTNLESYLLANGYTQDTLDNQLFYVISDEAATSTVWALWRQHVEGVYVNENVWMYQDASYYAKSEGVLSWTEASAHPVVTITEGSWWLGGGSVDYPVYQGNVDGVRYNGGTLNRSMSGSNFNRDMPDESSSHSYKVYVATSPYNRLHYLQESLIMLGNQLYSLDANVTVQLITFAGSESVKGSYRLNEAGLTSFIQAVSDISTTGGTRYDLALDDAYNFLRTQNTPRRRCILITDGALQGGSDFNQTTCENTARNYANQIKALTGLSTMTTIGLSMNNVLHGAEVLASLASPNSHYMPEDTSDLTRILLNEVFDQMSDLQYIDGQATIRDTISDSFYLINPADNTPFADGTWLDINGNVVDSSDSQKAGQVHYDAANNQWYVEWLNQTLPGLQDPSGVQQTPWRGRIYVKAKEDFVGGNTIDTNKDSATINLLRQEGTDWQASHSFIELDTPTVNVRLLPMNQANAKATVFLGDDILRDADNDHAPDVLKDLLTRIKFTKLVNPSGDAVYNRSAAAETEGLETDSFTLDYALRNQFISNVWQQLATDGTVTIPYTYDNDSSHGPVGAFTLTLTKHSDKDSAFEAADSGWGAYETKVTGENVYHYDLDITYTAYGIGGADPNDRPVNVHNGTNGPGTVVGTGTTLEAGSGTVTSNNGYDVSVVGGRIIVEKEIDNSLVSKQDQKFYFTLIRLTNDDGTWTPHNIYVDENGELQKLDEYAITVPAGETTGSASIVFKDLPRGYYVVREFPDDMFHRDRVHRVDDGDLPTNSHYQQSPNGLNWVFHIGYDTTNSSTTGPVAEPHGNDIVTYNNGPTVDGNGTLVYSTVAEPTPNATNPTANMTDAGIDNYSRGHVQFYNTKTLYTGYITVEKRWEGGALPENLGPVYVMLTNAIGNRIPFTDSGADPNTASDRYFKVLRLDATNNWTGRFEVPKDSPDDTTFFGTYTVRELNEVSDTKTGSFTSTGYVVNAPDSSPEGYEKIYFNIDTVLVNENGVWNSGNEDFVVHYRQEGELTTAADGTVTDNRKQVVANVHAFTLPSTGGMGTKLYTLTGILLMAVPVVYGYRRRRRERRAER